jgi:hypothetical protein
MRIRTLAAISANPEASLADLARILGWSMRDGAPYTMKVKRARDELIKAKLVAIERGKAALTERVKKLAETLVMAGSENSGRNGASNTVMKKRYEA